MNYLSRPGIGGMNLSLEKIESIICQHFDIDSEKLKSKKRDRDIVEARQFAMYFSRIRTKKSYAKIGKHFGGFDHSTVFHSFKVVDELSMYNKEFRSKFNELKEIFSYE